MKTLLSRKRANISIDPALNHSQALFRESFSARRIAVRSVKDAVKDRNKMANGHGGEDYYKTARAEKKGRLRDFAIHVTSPSCRVLSHAPLGFINVRHNSAMYIYIHTFFFSSCAINRRGRIFLHYFSSSCIPEDCYCQSVDRCPHRGEHVYACKTLLYHIFSFTLLFCFLIFFFSFLLLFRNRWNIKFSIRSQRSSSFSFFSFFFKE